MQTTRTEFCVISHTHWDREWHQSFERFRMKLVNLIDNLFDVLDETPDYVFHLDAQSICVEDYLAIRPAREELLRRSIAEGRVLIGPWYVQNDFYLTSGEATVRNLLIGTSMAAEYGRCQYVGYAPDQFGNISQLPQILRQFGIDNFIFGRGFAFPVNEAETRERAPGPTEFIWRSRDGSEVLAIHLAHWYNNAQRFSADTDRSLGLVLGNERLFAGRAATPYLLLMNGVDHLEAQEDLFPILEQVGKRLPQGRVVSQDTLANYVAKVSQYLEASGARLTRHLGELRNGWDVRVYLANTASSRIYLKTQNVRAQVLLENVLEPLYSMIAWIGADDLYPADYLKFLWKTLIQNHAHDSICGCSVDAVHRNMEDRFLRVFEAGGELLEQGMTFLAAHVDRTRFRDDEYLIVSANTLGHDRSVVADLDLSFLREDHVAAFEIFTAAGEAVEYEVLSRSQGFYSSLSPINLPGNLEVDRYRVRMYLEDLAAFSIGVYRITPVHATMSTIDPEYRTERSGTIENDAIVVTVGEDGHAVLTDKRQGIVYENFYDLEETGDAGHSYEFASVDGGPVFTIDTMTLRGISVRESSLRSEIRVDYAADFPQEYEVHASRRSACTVENTISVTFRLDRNSPFVEITCAVGNRSKDHRVRLIVNTGIPSQEVQVAAPFDIVARTNTDYSPLWNSGDSPNSGFVTISDGARGVSVLNEGVMEYHHYEGLDGRIAFTLVRGTGYVDGNATDQPDHWKADENQTLRDLELRLAVYPHAGDAVAAHTYDVLQDFLVPVLVTFDAQDVTKLTGGRAPVQASGVEEHFFRRPTHENLVLRPGASVVRIQGDRLVFSAFKRAEDGARSVLRVFNPSDEQTSLTLEADGGMRAASVLMLNEKQVRDVEAAENRTEAIPVGPGQIVTVGFS